jgi:hypothetical protein
MANMKGQRKIKLKGGIDKLMRARILSRMFNSLNQQKQKMNNAKRKEK